MKTLFKLVKMEMSNIHFFKPGKNVALKEFLFMGAMFSLMLLYGTIFLNQVVNIRLREVSILIVFILAAIAAVYDFGTRINSMLYDYNQYKMISYLPVNLFHYLLAKMICIVAITLRWMLMIGLPFSMIYVISKQLPFLYLITCVVILINCSLLISIVGVNLMVVIQKARLWSMLGIVVEFIVLGVVTNEVYKCFITPLYLNQLLENISGALVVMIFGIILVEILTYLIESDYKEVLGQLEWKDGCGKKINADISNTSVAAALYGKEKKAFVNFKLYWINTMAPVVIFSVLLLSLCFVPREIIMSVIAETGVEKELLLLVPVLLCFVFGMSNPTYCSVSLEGKAIDVLKSKPLQFRDLLIAKIRVYLNYIIPFVILDSVLFGFAINKTFYMTDILISILFSVIFVIVIGIAGILLDVLFGNFEWVDQVTVVKQSITMPLQMLVCGMLVGIPSILQMGFHIEKSILYFLIAIIWAGIGFVLYVLTQKVAKRKLGI